MLLEILLCVMWRGVEGSDDSAWLERGQVFSALTKLATANELLHPVDQIKLRSDLRSTDGKRCIHQEPETQHLCHAFCFSSQSDGAHVGVGGGR